MGSGRGVKGVVMATGFLTNSWTKVFWFSWRKLVRANFVFANRASCVCVCVCVCARVCVCVCVCLVLNLSMDVIRCLPHTGPCYPACPWKRF